MDMGVTVHVSSYSHYSFDYRSGPQLKAPCSFTAGENDLKINDHHLILADNSNKLLKFYKFCSVSLSSIFVSFISTISYLNTRC